MVAPFQFGIKGLYILFQSCLSLILKENKVIDITYWVTKLFMLVIKETSCKLSFNSKNKIYIIISS